MFERLTFEQRLELGNGLELDPDCDTLRLIINRWENKGIPEWAQPIINR
jgi:hypothetical protein